MWKTTGKQLLKEFWIPALVAGAWTAYVTWRSPSIEEVVTNFGPSFFLAAWATGQFFRVRKQIGVEGGLKDVANRVSGVVERLEATSAELVNYATGGTSYCYARPIFNLRPNVVSFAATHVGQHPLHVNATVTLLDDRFVRARGDTHNFVALPIGDLPLHEGQTNLRCIAGFQAPNGSWAQFITCVKTESGEWCCASRVVRDGSVVREDNGLNSPENEELLWGWTKEHDGSSSPRPPTDAPIA